MDGSLIIQGLIGLSMQGAKLPRTCYLYFVIVPKALGFIQWGKAALDREKGVVLRCPSIGIENGKLSGHGY